MTYLMKVRKISCVMSRYQYRKTHGWLWAPVASTRPRNKLPLVTCRFLCNSMPALVALIQISFNSCNTLRRQNVTIHPVPLCDMHLRHAAATSLSINQSRAFPVTADPGKKDWGLPWQLAAATSHLLWHCDFVEGMCHSCDRTFTNTTTLWSTS